MTTSNDITLDHINAFFSLDQELHALNIAPTATGGAGINNIDQFPPPAPTIPPWRRSGTDYAKKYLEKEDEEMVRSSRHLHLGSSLSVTTLEDVEDLTGSLLDIPTTSDLDSETTQAIYDTYFTATRSYDTELTITTYREEILRQLSISPVLIIQGPTGCGKTTQVPQYILDHHQSKGQYCNIVVTQPRKIAAISIARRVCQERKWDLGSIVGYQVAMDPKVSPDTRLAYVTTGVLLEKLVNAKRMDMYTHVIIDEVHERNQDIDFALLLVKKFLKSNSPRVKVILMSATFDSSTFARYFSLTSKANPSLAPIVEITGKSKDVTEHYLYELNTLLKKVPEFDQLRPMIDPCLYDAVLKLMFVFDKIEKAEQNVPGDQPYAPKRGAVLIFLPGYDEISGLSNILQSASISQNFWIIPLHSSITVEEQTKVFRNPPLEQRKVIISTNIAESSITVPDVKYVIDFCLTKSLVTDPATNYTCLQLEWASKSNCIQRKGRAGRVDIGKVYRMVPRQFYDDLPDYNIPEIQRCPLTSTILHLKKLNLCEPQEMLAFAIDPPDLSDIASAVLQLKEGLALTTRGNNPYDGDLTFIGRVMANLPLDIKLSKLVIFGYVFHCLDECIIIAASLSLQSFFARPFQRALDAYKSKLAWAEDTFSDCLTYLYAYNMWKQHTVQGQFKRPGGLNEMQWADRHFIQVKRIREVDMLVKELRNRLEKLQILADRTRRSHDSAHFNTLVLKMVIAGAFFPNYFQQEVLDEQKINREINENDPHSTVIVTNIPPKHGILYASALKEMFLCCGNNIEIEFEESRAYIKFPRGPDSSTILRSVYLAAKMRKLRLPLELSVFSQEEADRKTRQLMSSKTVGSANRLISNRITVKCDRPKIQKVQLPELTQQIIPIFICHINNCGHFYARYVSPEQTKYIRYLETAINSSQGRNLKCLSKPPVPDMLYLAPYAEGNQVLYYRAQIVAMKKTNALVFFVDYGNMKDVNIHELREIDDQTDILHTPLLAFECHLAEVKPSSVLSSKGDWFHTANEWFKKKVDGQQLYAKVYSVVQDTARLEILKIEADGTRQSINKQLIKMAYAEYAEESLASKQNHEMRRVTALDDSWDRASRDNLPNDLQVSWKEANEYDRMHRTGRKIRLHGPFNPLEVAYSGMTMLDRSKVVKVERDSVNSVSFNAEPQDPYTSLLVAASVSVSPSSSDLITRNTTLMPKLRGLPSLMCLIFTPFAEIRTDREHKQYTGAICGLGFDPETGKSLYPEHDIEIAFDIELTLNDIRDINAIRMGFNLLLNSDTDVLQYPPQSVARIHDETRNKIRILLQKIREPLEPVNFRRPHQWNQIPVELLLETSVDASADAPHVLPLHRPSSLVSFEMQLKEKRKHLQELHRIADTPTTEVKIIRCQLCGVDLTSSRNLLLHLDSKKHQERERDMGRVE